MSKELANKSAILIGLFMFFPFIAMYVSVLDKIALWLYAWIIPFCYIIFVSKYDMFSRGLFLIVYTVIILTAGYELIGKVNPEQQSIVENLSLMLTLMAGGIGANFMSHDLISTQKDEENTNEKV